MWGSFAGHTPVKLTDKNINRTFLIFHSIDQSYSPSLTHFSQAFLEVACFEHPPHHKLYGISMHRPWNVRCLSKETEKIPVNFWDGADESQLLSYKTLVMDCRGEGYVRQVERVVSVARRTSSNNAAAYVSEKSALTGL